MRFIKRHYPLIISSMIALQYFAALGKGVPVSWKTTPIYYPLMLYLDFAYIPILVTTILFPFIGLFLLVVIMSRFARLLRSKRKVKQPVFRQFLSDISALVLTLGLLAFSGLMFIAILMFDGDTYSHRDSVLVDDTIYNLAYLNTYDDLGYGSYVLFECDAEGRICNGVLSERKGSDYDSDGALNFDLTSNTIAIIHHGKPIATYQIPVDVH